MEIFMREKWLITKNMAKANRYFKTETFMKVNGRMGSLMVKGSL